MSLLQFTAKMTGYKIIISVFQTNPDTHFRVVEQTVWNNANGGTWDNVNEQHVLTMGGSGNSGTIRLLAENGENAIIALGIHNNKRWCDVVTNLGKDQTGAIVNGEYYSVKEREQAREKQLSSFQIKNSKGRNFSVKFTEEEGHELRANVIIG